MIHVQIDHAAARLAELLDRAVAGEDILIERKDGVTVRLAPVREPVNADINVSNEALASIDDRELNHFLC